MNILSLLLLIPLMASSLVTRANTDTDTLFHPSLKIGVDVSGFARNLLEPETMAFEISADLEWQKNWFAAIEAGFLDIDIKKTTHNYKAEGYFLRAGIDYNLLQKNMEENPGIVYGLLRYGVSNTKHEAPEINIHNPYWGGVSTSIPSEVIWSHWFELGGGLKTRLAGNFYVGWTLRARFLMAKSSPLAMEPYYIAGFGKFDDKPSVMVHYYIYYKIF